MPGMWRATRRMWAASAGGPPVCQDSMASSMSREWRRGNRLPCSILRMETYMEPPMKATSESTSVPKLHRRILDRKSTRLNSSHLGISDAVFFLLGTGNPQRSTLFPYTTVFRSIANGDIRGDADEGHQREHQRTETPQENFGVDLHGANWYPTPRSEERRVGKEC